MIEVNDFKKQIVSFYKGEKYSVRDNGSVLRHSRENKPIRKIDNLWTFGKKNSYGYLVISSEAIHRIVAYSFLGEPIGNQNVVDHIDTNRQNNRPENLRWLTRLENILNNPITLKKIVFYCGSIDAFLENPSILGQYVNRERNFDWMRTVTPEEARASWNRLSKWAESESFAPSSNGFGEKIFSVNKGSLLIQVNTGLVHSETPNAMQKNWKTPSKFPLCPKEYTGNSIETYAANLKIGKVFSINQYSNSIIEDYAISNDKNTLWIRCRSSEEYAIKPWTLAQVTFENELYVHESLGSFFQNEGSQKQFVLVQGLEWTGGETFDEFT
ncbi:HNH endonuclease signature motif containing protein [uncultured Algoriphagus sp.]|uniref:HNH endonuclease signature motif containing protein n=1 Tax=uncultured Algoriphagus sp. TaxID=417365 RepID=UPI0030EE571B|tara:strand:+ start:3575 stop:4555 length:981 start_codon:yes stop_codon:yes gene_type:complete